MPYAKPDALVSTAWLADHLDAPDVRVVDASWFFPQEGRDPRAEHAKLRIPGAVFFDIDEIADTTSHLPHMLPAPEKFSSRVRRLGLGDGVKIVVYDAIGLRSAARAWWMFRVFGHEDVAVLDGGLPKWLAEGRPVVEERPEPPRERHFTARVNNLLVKDRHQVARAIADGRTQLVDMRPADRFRGEAPEPRPGVRAGHVPGALNLPYTEFLDPMSGTVLDADRLEARILAAGIDPSKPVIAMCGSGVTAGMLALAMYLLGKRDVPVYDGSWADWGSDESLPIER
ncbi:3-mercaptopyruvate sulfurtransferase [Tistrella mobilis]|uniref:3-mercaptopyruvate sulfurtransferase n=1 Tax=Tistrella mobilis TaxID=171437 RepID=UPI0035584CC4